VNGLMYQSKTVKTEGINVSFYTNKPR